MSEISRQAENIGLVENGVYNKALTTVIGGGSDSFAAVGSNNGVQIDLSGVANRVDSKSLGIASLNIASTGAISAAGGLDFRNTASSNDLTAGETLTFKTLAADGTLTNSISVALVAGDASVALTTLQTDVSLQAAGITASVNAQTGARLSLRRRCLHRSLPASQRRARQASAPQPATSGVSTAANVGTITGTASTGARS
ncbi:MAG: hypothetical protein WKF84_01765 [Pyrinomonadaceae bacterium]